MASQRYLQPPGAVASSTSLASSSSSASSSSASPTSRNASSTNLSVNTTAPDHVSSAKARTSFRDRLAAGLHEHFPSLSLSGRVKAKILNQTPYPVQIVAWPSKMFYENTNTEGDDCDIQMRTHRGTTWENEVLAADTLLMPEDKGEGGRGVEIGSMRKAHSLQKHTHRGWIYLDLIKPDGSAVHLQIYLQLSRKGIKHKSSLGRFDLDSNASQPQPSGVLGRVVYTKTADEITYVITPAVAEALNTVDDSTKLPSRLLLGKGVEATTYVHHPGCRLSLFVGREARYHEHDIHIADDADSSNTAVLGEMRHTKHEVEGASSKFVGICSQFLGKEIFKAHVKIHPVTGIVDSGRGHLANTLKTRAIFSEPKEKDVHAHVLTYGFSDQGSGKADQIYAYLTKVHERWLGELIDKDPRWLDVPFSKLALAGAHDAGMWESLNPGLLFVIENGTLARGLAQSSMLDLGTPVVRTLVRALEKISFRPERALQNLANTQKDDTATLLRLGVRFFDFRPGYNFYDCIEAKPKEIRHQHALVPGETYLSFLSAILAFLSRHPKEIVVVELKKDGFVLAEDKHDKDGKLVANSMVPTVEALAEVLQKAREEMGNHDVQVAEAKELDSPIGRLIEANKRLFIVDRVHVPQAWYRSDSYDPIAHATDNPATIMAQLELTHRASSKSDEIESTPKRGCIYQLQATPTSRMVDAAKSALTFSDASSLLVWMKSRQDRETYPWIAKTDFDDPGLVVFLNDFCDGALVDHTIHVCNKRAGLA